MYWPNLKFIALPVPEIIAIGVLGAVHRAVKTKHRMLGIDERMGGECFNKKFFSLFY